MTRVTATDAARRFSELLNRVAAGEEFAVTRSGATVAVIGPPRSRTISGARFRELLASAPPVDEEFAADLERIRAEVGVPEDPWPS